MVLIPESVSDELLEGVEEGGVPAPCYNRAVVKQTKQHSRTKEKNWKNLSNQNV